MVRDTRGTPFRSTRTAAGRTRRGATVLASSLALAGGALAMAVPAHASYPVEGGGSCAIAKCVADWANAEYGNNAHNHEIGGMNCNYYSTQYHLSLADGAKHDCSNGWWSEEWCADFTHYILKTAGAKLGGLDHTAYSAKNYSTYQTYSSGRRPRVGDLAVWANESHVGIVVALSGGNAVVISGNSYTSPDTYTSIYKSTYSPSTFQGFAAPVDAG